MQIESIKQTELTQSERDVLTADTERWKRMGDGAHLDDWLACLSGLQIRRTLAMKLAHTNRPEGKGYALHFAELMKADNLDTMDKTSISCLLWLGDDANRLQALRVLRNGMTPGQRSRLNSPISARQRVEKVLKAREEGSDAKDDKRAASKARIAELEREVARLKQELAKSDGSLFDLKTTPADQIAAVIADIRNCGPHKAKSIAAAINRRLKSTPQKPAG